MRQLTCKGHVHLVRQSTRVLISRLVILEETQVFLSISFTVSVLAPYAMMQMILSVYAAFVLRGNSILPFAASIYLSSQLTQYPSFPHLLYLSCSDLGKLTLGTMTLCKALGASFGAFVGSPPG